MRLETFFEKFEQFADAPGAVGKMRELVLNLAVQGKLVPQDPNDEPAISIIKDTHIFFERLVAAKKISPPKPLQHIEDGDVPFSLPVGWEWCRFGQIMRISSGDGLVAKDMNAGPIPVYGGNGVNGYHDAHNVAKRTLVIGRVGFYCGSIHVTPEKAWVTDNAFISIFDEEHVDMNFLSWLLKATDLRERDNATAQPVISGGKVYPTILALPPLAEQKRIVAKVDELMALCDRLEAQQQERETRHAALARASLARFADAPTPANLPFLFHSSFNISPSDLRKSILTLAVQGKLVPQDPNDEPANITFPKLAGASVETDEDEFPAHWLRVPLGIIGEWRGGGTPSKSRPEFWKGDLPWVSPKDMKVFYISDAQDHISKAAVEGSSVRLIPPGSLLMVVRGMILARAFPVALTTQEVTINQDMKALLPSEPKIKNYLLLALRAFEPDVLAAIEHSSHGTCKLKTEFLHDFIMPIPPLAEQRRIVAKVDHLMAMVDQLEIQLTTARATAANLLDAIVAELTGTTRDPRSATRSSSSTPGTGRRGRPRKTA